MAAGATIKHKRKAGAFTNGELAAGEFGLDTNNFEWYFSNTGSTVTRLFALLYLDSLGDVEISAPNDGEVITYDQSSGKWIDQALELSDLSDVTISTPETHQFVRFNGAEFVNSLIEDAHLPAGIDAAKIADGSVKSTEFQYLRGVTSDIQTQLDAKVDDSQLDTDINLAANSDALIATQKAVKAYVDAMASGLDPKPSVRVATTANITLSGTQTIDGVSVIAGNRVLVKDQSTASQNGIYVCASGAWSRATDADASAEVTSGMYCYVSEGTTNASSGWVLSTADPISLGSTSLSFTQFSGAGQITAGAALTKTGNVLDVAVDNSTIEVSGDALRVKDAGITLAKLATMATASLLGRNTSGTGTPEVLSAATVKTLLALVKGDVGLGNVDNTSNATERAATATLTNKRIQPRTGTTTSSVTPTINTDNVDFYSITAQTADITSFTTNLSGTPVENQKLWIAITGTAARGITWGSSFEASTVALPTTTVSTNRLDVGFVWNTVTSKWRCIAAA